MFNRFRKYFSRRIYLDYASLAPIDLQVVKEVAKYSGVEYANPSSWYAEGVFAKKALAKARASVASFIHAHSDEIIFTSGGTESNIMALKGVVQAAMIGGIEKPHIIISAIEHSSVIETAKILEHQGCEVTYISVDKSGIIVLNELQDAIKHNTVLVSIMTVNNEIGTIQPIRDIAKVIRDAKKRLNRTTITRYPIFHTDAAQGLYEELFVEKMGVDLMTLDSGKIYGPRSVGCLFVKRSTPISPIMTGGGQEYGMRSGTENVSGIMGFAKAIDMLEKQREKLENEENFLNTESTRISELRNMMIVGLKQIRSDIVINGEGAKVSPHILNVSIPGIDNEFFVLQLDAKGVSCSTKSSCLLARHVADGVGRDEDESYVLRAIGADSGNSVRFSFGRYTSKRDIRKTLKFISEILSKDRGI